MVSDNEKPKLTVAYSANLTLREIADYLNACSAEKNRLTGACVFQPKGNAADLSQKIIEYFSANRELQVTVPGGGRFVTLSESNLTRLNEALRKASIAPIEVREQRLRYPDNLPRSR